MQYELNGQAKINKLKFFIFFVIFIGVFLGSWAVFRFRSAAPKAAGSRIFFIPAKTTVKAGKVVNLNLFLESYSDSLSAVQIEIPFNNSNLQVSSDIIINEDLRQNPNDFSKEKANVTGRIILTRGLHLKDVKDNEKDDHKENDDKKSKNQYHLASIWFKAITNENNVVEHIRPVTVRPGGGKARVLSQLEIAGSIITINPIDADTISATPTLATPTISPSFILTPATSASSEALINFKIFLPEISVPILSLSDVQVELRDGSNILKTKNTFLTKVGGFYQTQTPVAFTIIDDKSYSVFIKTRVNLGVLFRNIYLNKGSQINCVDLNQQNNTNCGEFTQAENKPMFSGESFGLDKTSDSYNKIDSADLQILVIYLNQVAAGLAASADFNLDGQVDISDLEIVGKNYGKVGD